MKQSAGFIELLTENLNSADENSTTWAFIQTINEYFTMLDIQFPRGWITIDDSEIANWAAINDSQTASWTNVNDAQTVTWAAINDAQTAGWANINDAQTPNWTDIDDFQG